MSGVMEEMCNEAAFAVKKDVVRKLLMKGTMSPEEIAEIAGLTLEEVRELAGEE